MFTNLFISNFGEHFLIKHYIDNDCCVMMDVEINSDHKRQLNIASLTNPY